MSNRLVTALILFILPVFAGISSHLAALPFAACILALTAVGAMAAGLALRQIPRILSHPSAAIPPLPASPSEILASQLPQTPSPEAAEPPLDTLATLRHDLRGILSPAVLTADKLSMHAETGIRADAEAILSALDRATERLRKG